MPISTQPQIGGEQQSTSATISALAADLRVAMPGIIQSFDPQTVTCIAQPAIRAGVAIDSESQSVPLPLLTDVPVVFPRGGGCTLTFPVRAGDECLLVVADRCIDFWRQSGGIQEPGEQRMHDMSDAFAIVGPQSQAQKISGISTTAAQLRIDDGSAFIELAAGGVVTITSPGITINGPVQVNGTIKSTGDQIAAGISQTTHTHGGVSGGNSNTGKPQ